MTFMLCLLLFVGSPQHVMAAPAESDLFSEAESRYLGKNYTAALEAYDAFLVSYPLSERVADVQYRRSVCLYRLTRYRDAVQLIDDIEKRYRSTRYFAYVPLWKGLSLYSLGSYSLAVESLDAFLAQASDPEFTPQALVQKSLALVQLADDTGAIASLTTLTASYQSSRLFPYASVLLGSLLQKKGDFTGLLTLAQGTNPASFPEPWKSQFVLLHAEALWQTGKPEEAQPLYIQLVGAADDVSLVAYGRLFAAAQKKQDLPGMRDLTQAAETRFSGHTELLSDLWTRVGAESFRQGALDSAEPFLRRAWNVRDKVPVNEVVPLYLAEISLGRKDAQAAKQILLDFLAAGKPGTGAVIIRLGDLALMGDDFAAAATYYAQFRTTLPDSKRATEAGYLLAYCLFRQGKTDDAAQLVDDLIRQDVEPSLRQQLAKLQIVLFNSAHRTADAATALKDYTGRYPTDLRSRLDYLKALFVLKKNTAIVAEADAVRRQFPGLEAQDPYAFIELAYLRGLSLIAVKDYAGAISDLASIKPDVAQKSGLAVIVPYARYYLGWAYLRTFDYAHAAGVFDELAAGFPDHELAPMTVYLAGWSHFSLAEFDKSATYFSAGAGGQDELSQKSLYLYAKSLLNMKKREDAAQVLLRISTATPPSPWAADALFDYAGALSDLGKAQAAADAYRSLADKFPDSPLREEATYRRAETFFTHGMWALARTAFDDYRTRFPKGKLVDAALYWGGQAALSMNEGMAAALQWEQLISGYKDSGFRGSALQQTAEAYAQAQQYPKSLEVYARFLSEYPDEARAARADIRAEQIRLLVSGEGDREAELSAIIARETGDKKRQATIDLAKLYIYSGDKRADTGYRLLQPLIKEGDPVGAPQAQMLTGEYFYRKGDLAEAARQFLATAVIPKVDPNLAAAAIYRAAEMMQLAKKPDEVVAIVKRLEAGFPSSDWTVKARLLEGGAQ
jgi:pentatricopeptide repeat protein